jgi:hypothetical protein
MISAFFLIPIISTGSPIWERIFGPVLHSSFLSEPSNWIGFGRSAPFLQGLSISKWKRLKIGDATSRATLSQMRLEYSNRRNRRRGFWSAQRLTESSVRFDSGGGLADLRIFGLYGLLYLHLGSALDRTFRVSPKLCRLSCGTGEPT